jgi:hypothetical protein
VKVTPTMQEASSSQTSRPKRRQSEQ